jgi:hypothetical protein
MCFTVLNVPIEFVLIYRPHPVQRGKFRDQPNVEKYYTEENPRTNPTTIFL